MTWKKGGWVRRVLKYNDVKGMKKKKKKHAFEQLYDKQCPQGIAKF